MDKLVSVIMPVYNSSRFLGSAIDSVLNQTHKNLELLIIDDKSTDNSLAIAEEYAKTDNRIRVIASQVNQGVAKARNQGIADAAGDYIALLDSDDVWCHDKLERQLRLLEEKNAAISYCSYDFIDENDNSIMKPFVMDTETNFRKMLYRNDIGCSTAVVEAGLMKAHPFDNSYYHEDYALWMQLLSLGAKAAGLSDVLTHYRRVSGSRSDNKLRAAKERWRIYRSGLNMGVLESAAAFVGYAISSVVKYFG